MVKRLRTAMSGLVYVLKPSLEQNIHKSSTDFLEIMYHKPSLDLLVCLAL